MLHTRRFRRVDTPSPRLDLQPKADENIILAFPAAKPMRDHPTDIISAMLEMLAVFESKCEDDDTLRRLSAMASNRSAWREGHALFQQIRQKTLKAEKRGDELALAQYAFEEICAKTLYNLSHSPAPFDADSAFWVVPLGVELGRRLGFTEPSQITSLLRM
ncbi:hypothetical protein [Bradyrhizobium yuanmingense]|uniref:hypothetical protein n=1 Tax=Bradyrhizobium yuanmingense TaxID=108015 RepID=UPI0023BA022D|nr:hypothetical protein [Bradyrhizobium yuanmingense]MDF0580798.1 hypothetical protein [Bradyrhizobium yuanmingense]